MNRTLLEAELVRDEGKRLVAYQDSVGLWTIGVGHLLGKDKRMLQLTESECAALLAWDIERAVTVARTHVPAWDALDDVRQRALVNMAFNLGGRLGGFRQFLAAVGTQDWEGAATAMVDSLWARQVGARAVRLQHMVRTGSVGGV